MKKHSFKFLLLLCGVLFLYILFNQVDSPAPPNVYTRNHLVPATFDNNNGFYLVLAFTEPPDVDVQSEEAITKYRRLFDPGFDNERFIKEWDYQEYQKLFDKYKRKSRFINQYKKDWVEFINLKKTEIENLKTEFSFLLKRYQRLLDREIVSDFTGPRFRINKAALLTVSRLYTALKIIKIQKGSDRVKDILSQISFCKKLIKTARSTYMNSIGKTILQESLRAINSLMNQKECQSEIFSLVFRELTPLKYEEFGSRNAFICYYLAVGRWIEGVIDRRSREGNPEFGKRMKKVARLVFQKQRTKNYYFYYISTCIDYEKHPPFKWQSNQLTPENLHKRSFWWLQNPTGKFIFSEDLRPDFQSDILKTHQTKILYDLTRIAAELHLDYTGKKPVKEILNRMESFRTPDPYSGKPYIWDNNKKILYSVGPNRRDDGGEFDPLKHSKEGPPDIVIPCVVPGNLPNSD